MFLSQSPCVLKMFYMEMAKNAPTPKADNIKKLFLKPVSSEAEHNKAKKFPYRSPVEILLYLCILSRFVKSPTTAHLVAAKCMFLYLQGMQETGNTISAVTSGSRMESVHLQGRQGLFWGCRHQKVYRGSYDIVE